MDRGFPAVVPIELTTILCFETKRYT
jgi:hypothetical protein